MIHQIAPVHQTTSLSGINKAILQARHIQAKIKQVAAAQHDDKPEVGIVWTPMELPYLVPITRWIE